MQKQVLQKQEQEQEATGDAAKAEKTEDEEETKEENEHSFENCSTGNSNSIIMTDTSNKTLALEFFAHC